jgi:hypothetical protein
MNENNSYLKQTKNLNRLLKICEDKDLNKNRFPQLLTITHKYTTRDDVLFPEISTLGFFTTFEKTVLDKLENDQKILYVVNDIDHGLYKFFIYCIDAKQIVNDCINYFKNDSTKKIDFHIQNDPSWSIYEQFKNL